MENWDVLLRELCCLPVFLWLAIRDKRYMEIPRAGLLVTAGVLLFGGCFTTVSWQLRVGGALFGAGLLAMIYLSKEALGVADGVIIFVYGIAFGLYEVAVLCFLATLFTSPVAGILLLTKKGGRKTKLPFFPFLLLGYVALRILQETV